MVSDIGNIFEFRQMLEGHYKDVHQAFFRIQYKIISVLHAKNGVLR